jgi:hypothetical protein
VHVGFVKKLAQLALGDSQVGAGESEWLRWTPLGGIG